MRAVLLLVAAAALAASPVRSQERQLDYLMVAYSCQGTCIGREPIFSIKPGSCIRGPLLIQQETGQEIFRLDAGTDFPAGCSKASP